MDGESVMGVIARPRLVPRIAGVSPAYESSPPLILCVSLCDIITKQQLCRIRRSDCHNARVRAVRTWSQPLAAAAPRACGAGASVTPKGGYTDYADTDTEITPYNAFYAQFQRIHEVCKLEARRKTHLSIKRLTASAVDVSVRA
ncbi:hypothetical protein Bbelb_230210 [Branchiostoma belcheri]|nr:hypothetical protein Bbelb_230210 [Branchiostoma belcheri]